MGVWSERYARTTANVLDVIDEVARGVATGVAGQLLPAETAELGRRPTADGAAYAAFLQGNFYLAQRTAPGFARAAEAYRSAATRDPGFKSALAREAYVYALGMIYGVGDLSTDSIAVRALRTVARAVREAPGSRTPGWRRGSCRSSAP